MKTSKSFDVAVIGAGVFGTWIAYQLRRAGASVVLLDGYGPGNSRASSGGESRIIRMGYGPDEIYTRFAIRSFKLWLEFFERSGSVENSQALSLFHQTGVLWLARNADPYCEATHSTLTKLQVRVERLELPELQDRYSQFNFSGVEWGLLEPESGALMARRAVQTLAAHAIADGTTFIDESVTQIDSGRKLDSLTTSKGTRVFADKFVFACGPWLPKLFPALLERIIHVTRQEVFFFGTPAGDNRFCPGQMPIWVDFNDLVYAIPNLENRGFKLAIDAHGPEFDPDHGDRVVTAEGLREARSYLQRRVPSLVNAAVVETRVCQYENTANGDFLIDLHPDFDNVWLVGGGSGHGFKHGPAIAEYLASQLSGGQIEKRFLLSTKSTLHDRQVY